MLNGMLELGLIFSLRDDCECPWCICEDVGCNAVTGVDSNETVDVDWLRNLVVKNS